jgi:DNA processing protein
LSIYFLMSNTLHQEIFPDSAWLFALAHIPGIGNKTLLTLLRSFGSGQSIWQAALNTTQEFSGIRPAALAALRSHAHTLDPYALWKTFHASSPDIRIIGHADADFPALLREIPDAPVLLYIRGTYDWQTNRPMITIVGTRRPSTYGRQVVQDFARHLSQAGFVVISGLAFGIDSLAHQATLESDGLTLAVIGSGVDDASLSPQSHLTLAHRIISQGGALISELAPGTKAALHTFPSRNRIMAGMSPATLVIEATDRGGTLITARLALEYNRDVLAIPGSLFSPSSLGCHRLIQRGAKLITCLEDILEEFPTLTPSTSQAQELLPVLSEREHSLLALLTHESLHIDQIIQQTKRSAHEITSDLTVLEMKGLAKNIGGMHYRRITNHS